MDSPDALQFWDFRVNIKGNGDFEFVFQYLLGHYKYNHQTGTLVETNVERDADITHVIISGHMEQDASGEDTLVLNFRMGSWATVRRMMDGAIRIFMNRLWTRWRLRRTHRLYRSTVTTYRHRDSGSGGEMTYRFGGNSRPSDDPPSEYDIVRKRLFFFALPQVNAENLEAVKGIFDRLRETAVEDEDGNFVKGINWRGQPVEVFLEDMGSNNYAILFRVLESSLDGQDIYDVLSEFEYQTRRAFGLGSDLIDIMYSGNWVISSLGATQNDTTRYDDNSLGWQGVVTKFYLTDAIPQQTTNLQTGDSNPQTRPTEVELGAEFSLEEFQNLGPFYIPEKLILDNLMQDDDIDYGCAFNLSENIEYPVLVTTKVNGKEFQKIYCADEIARWIGEMGKTEDPVRAPIVRIHIMTKEEVVAKEKALVEDKKKELNDKLKGMQQDTSVPLTEIMKLKKTIRELSYKTLKAEREKNRKDSSDSDDSSAGAGGGWTSKRQRLELLATGVKGLKF